MPGFLGYPAFSRETLPAWPLPVNHPVRRSIHLVLLSGELSAFQSLRPFCLGLIYQWTCSKRIPFALFCSLCTVFIFLPASILQQQLNSLQEGQAGKMNASLWGTTSCLSIRESMKGREQRMDNPRKRKQTQQAACRRIQTAFALVLGGCCDDLSASNLLV